MTSSEQVDEAKPKLIVIFPLQTHPIVSVIAVNLLAEILQSDPTLSTQLIPKVETINFFKALADLLNNNGKISLRSFSLNKLNIFLQGKKLSIKSRKLEKSRAAASAVLYMASTMASSISCRDSWYSIMKPFFSGVICDISSLGT